MKELNKCELQEVEGGTIYWLMAMVVDAAKEIAHEWDDFKRGLKGEPYQKNN
jgi:bacteriocin-like protein